MEPLKAFVSYASEDDAHRIALERSLRLLQREGVLETWSDRKILPGGRWGAEIDQALEEADLVLLLVSFHFIDSNYAWEIEMRRALERERVGEARVVPIIVDVCPWEKAPFAQLQALPERGQPVTEWSNPAKAWTSVAEGIRSVAEELRQTASMRPPSSGGPDPSRYLEAVRDECSHVDIRGMGAQVSERMELRTVYTRLHVSAPGAASEARHLTLEDGVLDEEGRRDPSRELRELLEDHPHAALVGDPGSGKTTFLRFVAQHLAHARLGELGALEPIGLSGEAPFPVFLRLERLASFLREHPDTTVVDDAPEHLYRYLEHRAKGHHFGLPVDYVRRRVLEGSCYLLLDGLDEVPGTELRERLVRLIEKVIVEGRSVRNRHLITCRTRAWQGRVQLSGEVATFRLAPLGEEQVAEFCDRWCRALYRVGADEEGTRAARQALDYREELKRAIAENPSGRTFSESPLMLTVLAVVHWNKRKLPEQRAELYDNAVEYLLESRRDLASHPTPLRRECLQAVAMAMFEHPQGVQRFLARREAARAVAPVLGVDEARATEHLESEELYSGLLVSRSEGEVEFSHLTFEEYLAARGISQDEEGWWSRIEPHLFDDRWSELVLLLAGCRMRSGGIASARRMIERVLAARSPGRGSGGWNAFRRLFSRGPSFRRRALAVALVGRIVRDLRAYGGDPAAGTGYAEMLEQTLAMFEVGGEWASEVLRVEVAEALGQAGDPRLQDAEANRVVVPGGGFWMGAQDSEQKQPGYDEAAFGWEAPVHRVQVSGFEVGRYPVTVQEFARFAAEGGYERAELWHKEGWSWRVTNAVERPESREEQLDHPSRPIVGVSWYEADAYCRWIGGRLPTEAEWEFLARGEEGQRYPWGSDSPSDRHANFGLRIGNPTPVGIYPEDRHPFGVRDLAGNVLEWCADWFDTYPPEEQVDPKGPVSGRGRVLRGGAFGLDPRALRVAYRYGDPPESRNGLIGFRVVWLSSGGR